MTVPNPGDLPATEPQRRKLFALLRRAGLSREERLAEISWLLGREVASTNDLTRAEMSRLIDALTPGWVAVDCWSCASPLAYSPGAQRL